MRSALLLFLCAVAGAFAATPRKLIQTAPIQFEQAAPGQWSARGLGYAFRFEKTGTAMRLGDGTLRMTFEHANPAAPFTGLEPSAHPTNSFRGHTFQSLKNYTRLRRTAIYPGIDLLYYSRNGELEYDFEIAPGADPSRIALRFQGADSVKLNQQGDLILSLHGKELTQRAPSVYQRRASGETVAVQGAYKIGADGVVRFHLGNYDRQAALVIDPSIVYVAFLGGSDGDVGVSVGHDAQGDVYVGGYTYSPDFPVGGYTYSITPFGDLDCYIIKLNPNATDPTQVIVYSTFYGGTSDDILTDMKVSETGLVYFTGNTDSTNFPASSGAFANVLAVSTHAFMTELDTTQNGIYSQIYSTYFGGTVTADGSASSDSGEGIFVAASGRIYLTGWTTATDYPTTGAFQGAAGGAYDAFVAEFDPTQAGPASLIFSSYMGGGAQDWGSDIAVDSNGLIYVTGYTFSADFPFTSSSAFSGYAGGGDAYLTVINPGSGTVVYSTFLGGPDGFDNANKIVVDPAGKWAAIAGFTLSSQFPKTQNAFQPVMPALTNVDASGNLLASNAFLAIFDLTVQQPGQGLMYSTYFGGFGGEVINDMRRDSQGNYYLAGYTLSQNFPVTGNALNTVSAGGGIDGFVSVLNPAATTQSAQLVYSSYVTSPGTQTVYGIDLDDSGVIWITGVATGSIFPEPYEQFPISPSTLLPQPGKQSSFVWGFTIP